MPKLGWCRYRWPTLRMIVSAFPSFCALDYFCCAYRSERLPTRSSPFPSVFWSPCTLWPAEGLGFSVSPTSALLSTSLHRLASFLSLGPPAYQLVYLCSVFRNQWVLLAPPGNLLRTQATSYGHPSYFLKFLALVLALSVIIEEGEETCWQAYFWG